METIIKKDGKNEIAVFGGGCFWCTEAVFLMLQGVVSVMPGYAGGILDKPDYDEVSTGTTGHAEVIMVEYDPSIISYDDLLAVFFNVHDPTTLNRQGNDIGTQYRSVIFYTTDIQKQKAEDLVRELRESHAYERDIVTEIKPLPEFFPAEEYHRDYYNRNKSKDAYCEVIIAPKLEKLQTRFQKLMKDNAKI